MPEARIPVELGFSEFVAKLVSEVFDAVVATAVDQERRQAELVESAGLDLADFAPRHVAEAEVDAALAGLFPDPEDPTGAGHRIRVGARYAPPSARRPEDPPVADALGIALARGDYEGSNGQEKLTEKGVERVREAARLAVAAVRLDALRTAVRRGVPRVSVDAGRILARLTFRTLATSAEGDGAVASSAGSSSAGSPSAGTAGSAPSRSVGPSISASATAFGASPTVSAARPVLAPAVLAAVASVSPQSVLPDVRLAVKQADETGSTSQSATVYGEVEIRFKTVT